MFSSSFNVALFGIRTTQCGRLYGGNIVVNIRGLLLLSVTSIGIGTVAIIHGHAPGTRLPRAAALSELERVRATLEKVMPEGLRLHVALPES